MNGNPLYHWVALGGDSAPCWCCRGARSAAASAPPGRSALRTRTGSAIRALSGRIGRHRTSNRHDHRPGEPMRSEHQRESPTSAGGASEIVRLPQPPGDLLRIRPHLRLRVQDLGQPAARRVIRSATPDPRSARTPSRPPGSARSVPSPRPAPRSPRTADSRGRPWTRRRAAGRPAAARSITPPNPGRARPARTGRRARPRRRAPRPAAARARRTASRSGRVRRVLRRTRPGRPRGRPVRRPGRGAKGAAPPPPALR